MKRLIVVTSLVAACGGGGSSAPDAASDAGPIAPNLAREITDTNLSVDLSAMTATATLTLSGSNADGATFETGNLAITSVTDSGGSPLHFTTGAGSADGVPNGSKNLLLVDLPSSTDASTVTIAYAWKDNEDFTGVSKDGYTFNWPYYCGNMFPCHSEPSDGTTFELALANVPTGSTAVFPATIPSAAPSYQLAWSIGAYTELPLGTTTAGTQVSTFYRPGEVSQATAGTAHLLAAWDWLETNIGPYHFGTKVGTVSVVWPLGFAGGMEHHPFVHVDSSDLSDENTHIHESAHGWYGDGIRIACWEDFVLSEGTVSYLAGHIQDVLEPSVGSDTWTGYAQELGQLTGTELTWPDSCNTVDVLKDNLYTNAPYMRGAFFYRAVALKVGADKLDMALAAFYAAHAGQPAHMSDMLDTIKTVTGYDPTTCAQSWLRSTTIPAAESACD